MLIHTSTEDAMESLVRLFASLRDDPRMNVGEGIVAVGRPEPSVPDAQYAHVRVAYDRGRSPFGEDRTFVIHHAMVDDEGALHLAHGTYDLTREEAWHLVRYGTPLRAPEKEPF